MAHRAKGESAYGVEERRHSPRSEKSPSGKEEIMHSMEEENSHRAEMAYNAKEGIQCMIEGVHAKHGSIQPDGRRIMLSEHSSLRRTYNTK